jgi:hypothetical protein
VVESVDWYVLENDNERDNPANRGLDRYGASRAGRNMDSCSDCVGCDFEQEVDFLFGASSEFFWDAAQY